VTIDIDPNQYANQVNLGSRERLTVAIFSTNGFDAATIVPGSLRLAGASQRGAEGIAGIPGDIHSRLVDLNGDGRTDMQVEFRVPRLRLGSLDLVVDLWGFTRDLVPFTGSDVVQLIH
jgi:hypothetical protein